MDSLNSMNNDQFSIIISSVATQSIKNKKHTIYNVVSTLDTLTFQTVKRYQDFLNFYSELKNQGYKLDITLKSKRHVLDRLSSSTMSKRLASLNQFLELIIKDAQVSGLKSTMDFFGIPFENMKRFSSNATTTNDNTGDEASSSSLINLGSTQNYHVRPSDFEFLKHVGKGSYGKVYMARHKTEDKIYAIKVLDKSKVKKRNEIQHVMAERNVMVRIIDHPFLVKIHYSFQTTDKLYFVVDFINGGELFYHLQNEQVFSEPRAKFYSAEIISAIGCLHSHGVIYRDLKPENILVDSEGHVKLTDFGLCKEGMISSTERTSTFCGTPEYLAPEIIRKKPYTRAVDWWSTGSVLYEMLTGMPPFYNKNYRIMHHDIINKSLEFRHNVSETAKDLLKKLLDNNPDTRLGSAENDVKDIQNHKFYDNINWIALDLKKIKPPLIYKTSNKTDLRFIDPEFVKEPVSASVIHPKNINNAESVKDDAFLGFTYVNVHTIDEQD